MKKFRLFFVSLSVITVCGMACNSNSGPVKDAKEANAEKADSNENMVSDNDAIFAVNAAHGGMAEVALSQLALNKTQDSRIRDFANMMVKDHEAANATLKQLATRKNITLPDSVGSDVQGDIDQLNHTPANKFDAAYIDLMVRDHNNAVSDFKDASTHLADSGLSSFAVNTLPVLIKHQQAAKMLQDELEKKK